MNGWSWLLDWRVFLLLLLEKVRDWACLSDASLRLLALSAYSLEQVHSLPRDNWRCVLREWDHQRLPYRLGYLHNGFLLWVYRGSELWAFLRELWEGNLFFEFWTLNISFLNRTSKCCGRLWSSWFLWKYFLNSIESLGWKCTHDYRLHWCCFIQPFWALRWRPITFNFLKDDREGLLYFDRCGILLSEFSSLASLILLQLLLGKLDFCAILRYFYRQTSTHMRLKYRFKEDDQDLPLTWRFFVN